MLYDWDKGLKVVSASAWFEFRDGVAVYLGAEKGYKT